jgi:hypothetical protein
VLASVAPDITDALYWVIGFCSPYGLYSHTIHAVVLEAALIGGVVLLVTGSRTMSLVFVIVVLLHVPADYITGRKLVVPGGEMVGLRLYDRPWLDWVLEVLIAVIGWWLLRRSGRAPRWAVSLWTLLMAVLLQTTLDALSTPRGGGFKPNACPVVSSPISQ